MYKKVIYQGVDPAFLLDAFPLDGRTLFLFIYENLICKKRLGFATYFVLFLNGKQNKKENSKCDSSFGKRWSVKKPDLSSESGYLSKKYGKDHNTPLSL